MATSYSFPGFSAHRPERYTTPPPPSRDQIERSPSTGPETNADYTNRGHLPQNDLFMKGLGFTFGDSKDHNLFENIYPVSYAPATSPIVTQNSPNGVFDSNTQVSPAIDNNRFDHQGRTHRGTKHTKGHTRSGSTIDTLATIALATSPAEYHSPSAHFPDSYNGGFHPVNEERPAKRARSEKLPSPAVTRRDSRPATSYIQSNGQETLPSREDAELLLNLSNGTKFSANRRSNTNLALKNGKNPQCTPVDDRVEKKPTQVAQATSHHEPEAPPLYKTSDSVRIPEEVSITSSVRQRTTDTPPQTDETATETPPTSITEDTSGRVSLSGEAHGVKDKESEQQPQALTLQGPADTSIERSAPATPPLESSLEKNSFRFPKRKASGQVPQALCAKCEQAQITVAGEDQDVNCWIGCESCKRWFHYACAGFKDERDVRIVDKFFCTDCERAHGPTTYVRKSSRARTAIDYAGLNQGMVQSSADTPDHSYIKPIKDGKITFQADNFARMRPEDVTAEFFERSPHGMPRPVVVPAEWNPQPHLEARPMGTLDDGDELIEFMADESDDLDEREELALINDAGQDQLGMIMPRDLTVRKVSELYGPEEKLDVIDVKSQQADKRWTLAKWADYYESQGEKAVRNVISLEISQSTLGRLIRRPKIVRDLDLQDAVWPAEMQAVGDSPNVQFYCLMSVADCYTDFHIDFGGSSVYYHILKGKKTFFFIPPKDAYLKKYTDWCNSPTQGNTFLGNETGECMRVDLYEGDTMLIPSGWIHAVWTPEDSLVIGGNFLTRMSYEMQIKINQIERDTHIAIKFRYPFFQKVNWYTAIQYIIQDPVPQELIDRFYDDEHYVFPRARMVYEEVENATSTEPGTGMYNQRYYSQREIEGLPALREFLYRTARIAAGHPMDGVTGDTKRAVTRSVPKSFGDPMHLIKTFAMWCAWKTGNVEAPEWVRSDTKPVVPEKKDKTKKPEAHRLPGERQSSRVLSQQQSQLRFNNSDDEGKKIQSTPKPSGLGSRRIACEACRKRRIRCHHKEEDESFSTPTDVSRSTASDTSSVRIEVVRPNKVAVGGLDGTDDPAANAEDVSQIGPSGTSFPGNTPFVSTPTQPVLGVQPPPPPPPTSSTGKRARTKACDACRKSKRRCTHDEHGNVDPRKEAEPSRPRGSGTGKRTANANTDTSSHPRKKNKRDSDGRRGSAASSILVDTARPNMTPNQTGRRRSSTNVIEDGSLVDSALRAETAASRAYTPELFPNYLPSNSLGPQGSDYYFYQPEDNNSRDGYGSPAPIGSAQQKGQETQIRGAQSPYQAYRMPFSGNMEESPSPERYSLGHSLQTMAVSALDQATRPSLVVGLTSSPPDTHESRQPHQAPSLTVQTEITSVFPVAVPPTENLTASMVSPPNSSLQDSDPQMSPNVDSGFEVTDSIETGTDQPSGGDQHNNTLHTPRSTSVSRSQESGTKSPKTMKTTLNEADPDTESMKLIKELAESEFGLRRRSTKT